MDSGGKATGQGPKSSNLQANVLWLYGMQGVTYLVPALLLPYLVRVLGVEQYGLLAIAQALAQYFTVGTDYGFNYSATRAVAQAHDDPSEISRVFWAAMAIKGILLVVGALILLGLTATLPFFRENASIYLAAYVAVIGNAIFPIWLFQGMERMSSISIITAVARVISALLVICLVHGPGDTFLALLLLSLGSLIAGGIGMTVALCSHVSSFAMPTRRELTDTLSEGRHLFLTTAAISLYSNTNTFLVGLIGGNAQAGYFSLADKIIRVVTGLIAPFIQAAYPHTVRLVGQSRDLAVAFLQRTLKRGLIAGLAMGLLILVVAHPLARFVFRQNAPAAIPLLQAMSLFPVFGCLNFIFGTLVLIPLGFDRAQSRFLIGIGIANVCLGCLLIPRFGALGGGLAMSTLEVAQTVGSAMIVVRAGVPLFEKVGT